MTSIYRQELGQEFDRLHPKQQWRFGLSSADGTCQVGTGVMDEVWRGPWWTLPFLLVGSTRRVLFPSRGRDVPFTISNYAYRDRFGRETVTWSRRFTFGDRQRCFDATMVRSEARGTIIDYLGTHQHPSPPGCGASSRTTPTCSTVGGTSSVSPSPHPSRCSRLRTGRARSM